MRDPSFRENHQTFVLSRKRVLAIYEFVEGETVPFGQKISNARLMSAARALAALHVKGKAMVTRYAVPIDCSLLGPVEELLGDSVARRLSGKATHPSAVRTILDTVSPVVERHVSGLKVDLPRLPDRPTTMIHNDYHRGNLIFSGEEVAAVVDFDTVYKDTLGTTSSRRHGISHANPSWRGATTWGNWLRSWPRTGR